MLPATMDAIRGVLLLLLPARSSLSVSVQMRVLLLQSNVDHLRKKFKLKCFECYAKIVSILCQRGMLITHPMERKAASPFSWEVKNAQNKKKIQK